MTRVFLIPNRATANFDPSFRRLHNTYAYTDTGRTVHEFKRWCPAREMPLRPKLQKGKKTTRKYEPEQLRDPNENLNKNLLREEFC